jgi:hypothetical protein
VGDEQQGAGAAAQAVEDVPAGEGIEGSEAFVGDEELGVLEEGAGEEEPGLLAVGELPAAFADALPEAGGEAVEKIAEGEVAADGLGGGEVGGRGRPGAAEEEIEGERVAEDEVFVRLGDGGDQAAPGGGAAGVAIEAADQEQAGGGGRRPARTAARVDLPELEEPVSSRRSPERMVRSQPAKTGRGEPARA